VGDTSFDTESEAQAFTIGVAEIKQHPQYNSRTLENDISILVLKETVSFTDYPNIKPVCIPEAGATFPGEAVVSGWGTTESGGQGTSVLNEVGVTVFPDGQCGSMNPYMTSDMICAGLMAGGKDSCQGDSGGPLVAADPAKSNSLSLVGVVSWGFGCADPDSLGIYSEVSHFTNWLQDQMPDINTCPVYAAGWNNTSGTTSPSPSTTGSPVTTTGSPVTTTGSPVTTSTTELPATGPACVDNAYPKFQVVKRIKRMENWEGCRDACNDHADCTYFNFKDNKLQRKRVCFLMDVGFAPKNGRVSGEKFCV